jgi:hypothetical protein
VARDSLSSCLKDRTLALRLTSLEMEKKSKQKLERKVSQSPCFFSTIRLYYFIALPFKIKEKVSILRSHWTCPLYGGSHRSARTLVGEDKDFRVPFLKRIGSGPLQPNMGVAHKQVLG